MYDPAVTIELSALCVGYDRRINPHQVWTDKASCKENAVGSLLWFGLV
jgi:hypothetical protein